MGKNRFVGFGLVSVGLLSIASAMAGDLRAPFDFETTAVLPRGVRNPRFKVLVSTMDERFGSGGGTEPLGARLNKTVTWQDVIDSKDDPTERAIVEGKVGSLGFSKNDSAGTSAGVVNTYMNVKVPVLAMGVTEKLTMAVAVPVVDVEVNADTGFQKSQQGQDFVNSVGETDPEKGREAADNLNNAINSKLKRLGYEPIESKKVSNIGDIKVVGKYLTYQSDRHAISVKGETTLPTGTPPHPDKALDIPTGDGQWDVGAGVIYDYYVTRDKALRANTYVGYVAQLPDEIERRLPTSEYDSLSRDKELLERDLGDIYSAGAGLTYQFASGLNFGAAYGFQFQERARYEGSKFSRHRYSLLEAGTLQAMHSATAGVGYSTVELFKQKQFALPLQLNLAYSKPFKGRNVVKNELLAFEFVMFF